MASVVITEDKAGSLPSRGVGNKWLEQVEEGPAEEVAWESLSGKGRAPTEEEEHLSRDPQGLSGAEKWRGAQVKIPQIDIFYSNIRRGVAHKSQKITAPVSTNR